MGPYIHFWEVVKKYYPNEYVTTAGIGYDTFLDALMTVSLRRDGRGELIFARFAV